MDYQDVEVREPRKRIHRLRCSLRHPYWFYLQIKRDGGSETPFVSDLRGVMVDEKRTVAGTFKAEIIHLGELEESGNSLYLECDTHSKDLCDLYEGLILEDKPLHHLEYCPCDGLAYLNRLKIEPAHRGLSLGLEICASMLDWLSRSCEYAVIKPFPLQWRGELDGSRRKERQFQKDRKKLTQYYRPLGFAEAAPGNDYHIRELFPTPLFDGIHTDPLRPVKKGDFPSLDNVEFD